MIPLKMKPIIILSAIKEEIQDFLDHFSDIQTQKDNNFITYHTNYLSMPVILSTSGVGKVSAAMTTQYLINKFNPETIFFTGIAGALNSSYEIGDIIIANICIQYDIDASELGFPPGTIPYTNYHKFSSDHKLLDISKNIKTKNTIHFGTILTGDQFISHKKRINYQHLFDYFKGDAIEMEGAALAHVCTHNNLPFMVIRTISDKADETAPKDFNSFLKNASERNFNVLKALFEMICN